MSPKRSNAAAAHGSVDEAIAAIRQGAMVIMVDAPDRENEGDLVMAAEFATPEAVNFMTVHGRGLICAPMPKTMLDRLAISPMTARNTEAKGTAFHVSVDHARRTTTGISASDRAATLSALADPAARAGDFNQPGHIFPLAARSGGVRERAGHTEASVELMDLAGLRPVSVICEVLRADGEMARMPELTLLAGAHGLVIVTIEDIIARVAADSERLTTRLAGPIAAGGITCVSEWHI